MSKVILNSFKFVAIDIVGDFAYFPIWWYTVGLINRAKSFMLEVKNTWRALALGLWLKAMFMPMYDDRSILGRGISLVMRIIILIWKLAWFILWAAIVFVFFLLTITFLHA